MVSVLFFSDMAWDVQLCTQEGWEFIKTGCPSILIAQKWLISTLMAVTNLYTKTAHLFLSVLSRYLKKKIFLSVGNVFGKIGLCILCTKPHNSYIWGLAISFPFSDPSNGQKRWGETCWWEKKRWRWWRYRQTRPFGSQRHKGGAGYCCGWCWDSHLPGDPLGKSSYSLLCDAFS